MAQQQACLAAAGCYMISDLFAATQATAMNTPSSPSARASRSLLFSQVAAVLVMLVGVSVLGGWLFDVPVLKSVAPTLVSMVANTALCLLALGLALFLQGVAPAKPKPSPLGPALALCVAAIAGLTLLEYLGQRGFGIDQLLFVDDTRTAATDHPGRMAPVTAISLVLCSVSLLLARRSGLASTLAVMVLFLATLSTTGYLFDVGALYQVIGYTSIAVHTSVTLMLLSLGILASRPQHGVTAIILSDTAGGETARRMLLLMPLLLVLLNWLVLQGEQVKLYDGRFGLAIASVSSIAIACGVILLIARQLHASDLQRQLALTQLATLNSQLERIVTERTQALTVANQQLADEVNERKQAQEHVHRLSLTDELTGLLNRRGFNLLAGQALKTARRVVAELSLIYIDVDGLKRVNDSHGHQAGDSMIIDTAQLLKATFRESDLIARLGGDEFTILAVGGETLESMLARLQQAVTQFTKGSLSAPPRSCSVGPVRCLPQEDKSLLELLADADALMYQQKRQRS
jgi:diguanylate cyclase (GGDEF)-like protein